MKSLSPYLNFPGTTEQAFVFYRSVFGGEFTLHRFRDTPMVDQIPEADRNKVMHVALPLVHGIVLMGSDACGPMGEHLRIGTNVSVSVDTENEAEATRLFNALAVGGQVTMALQTTFWGAFFGMLTDRFAIQWMVNYTYPQAKA